LLSNAVPIGWSDCVTIVFKNHQMSIETLGFVRLHSARALGED
jgi:hypothetical protein